MEEISKTIYLKKEKNLKIKIFDYFYYIIYHRKSTSSFFLVVLYILEIIQIISFAFTSPHTNTWKISSKSFYIISNISSSFRLSPLVRFISFKAFESIFFIFNALQFIFLLNLLIQVLFRESNSKIYDILLSVTHFLIDPLSIFFFIPIIELFLIPLKCCDSNIFINKNEFKCWSSIHYLFITLGSISAILFFISIIFLNIYYFSPFQIKPSTIKLNSLIDVHLLQIKFIYMLKYIFIKNEYISIVILLILSIFLLYEEIKNPIYNESCLELIVNIRNILIVWTFFMLLVAKLCFYTKINNLIYLLIFGYPIIIFSYIMFYKDHENTFNYTNHKFNNINSCLSQTLFLIKLIDSFIDNNNNNLKYKENTNSKNDILLKGFIKIHSEKCLKEDCPLTKFIKNEGNFIVQKQCLLNYMSIYFNKVIKTFPYNLFLKLYYIHFNFSKNYHLNNAKTNLELIKKMEYDMNEEFIIYCLEQQIMKSKNKEIDFGNEAEKENSLLDHNYKRLKDLITSCTNLYVEFWGILAKKIKNNINISKFYKIGENLNIYLREIKYLWENNLKDKKISIENEVNAQIYCRFLREILWDQKNSQITQKKIYEDHNNRGNNTAFEEHLDSYKHITESQDYMLYLNSTEKGKCRIIQFSNSLIYLVRYQKIELINKPLEYLIPTLLAPGLEDKMKEYINSYHVQRNSEYDSFQNGDKNKLFILIKDKMGYLIPFNAQYTIFDDTDFSYHFLIKTKLELTDTKSSYAYYILTNSDFSIEAISSSAIHLGLSMDLLKKYVIKINILIRNSKDSTLKIFDKYREYIEEPKKIIWVYPNIIYPKNDNLKKKDMSIQDLVKISGKKAFNLQIMEMRFKEGEILGFLFKITEIKGKKDNKKKTEILIKNQIPHDKNEVIFNLLKLNYIRTILVTHKSGFRNLRENLNSPDNSSVLQEKKRKKDKRRESIDEYSEEETKYILTKDKILELQGKYSREIKTFINILDFYGNDISLVRHRPNKEQYPCGIAQEPLIKINLSNFTKRIETNLKENPKFLKRISKKQAQNEKVEEKNEKNEIKINQISTNKQNENDKKEMEETNTNFIKDSSLSLMNIFNVKSIKTIKYIDFFIYIFIISIIVIEFILNYSFLTENENRFLYFTYPYKFICNLLYSKYFINELVFTYNVPNYIFLQYIEQQNYTSYIKEELSNYQKELSGTFNEYNRASVSFSKEYSDTANINIVIKTLSNGIEKLEEQPFSLALSRIITSIFYISTIPDNEKIEMNDSHLYEVMVNVLDHFFAYYESLINIVIKDLKEFVKNSGIKNIIIFLISIFISFIYLFIFYKMMNKLDNDREKPINLFLTIKKNIFEDLENSAENFSNKLLNNVFGGEESEEESQQDYKNNLNPNDINFAKFKVLNELKAINNKGISFFSYFAQLAIFFLIINIMILIKYINTIFYYRKMENFIDIYNSTYYSQILLITRIDVHKQFYYNSSITNFNLTIDGTFFDYLLCFFNLPNQFEFILKEISKKHSFSNEIKNIIRDYFYENITHIIKDETTQITGLNYEKEYTFNFNTNNLEFFEMIRYITVKYFINTQRNNNLNISELINDYRWLDISEILINIIRPWYQNFNKYFESLIYKYIEERQIYYIYFFIIQIVLVSLYYWIIWKKYENEFFDLIKKSFDLINLIPEDLKDIIVNKLNEPN